MIISERNFNKIFNLFLLFIGTGVIFRIPCTWLLVVFAVFNLFFINKTVAIKKGIVLRVLITLPLLLELLFFFNNDSYINEIKFLEKYASLALFAWFIIGNYQRVIFSKLIAYYAFFTLYLVLFFFFVFVFNNPLLIDKYQNGVDLWEVGYVFSESFGMHAPGLNMHMAFVSIIFIYLTVKSFQERKETKVLLLQICSFIICFFLVLFINTRMALLNVFLGMLIVFFYALKDRVNFNRTLKISSISIIISLVVLVVFIKNNNYMSYKYNAVTFAYMDKVGKLDEIENPELKVYNSLVTRLSIWKSVWELSVQNLPFGVGASHSKPALIKYYQQTNQHFLAKYEFPACNQFLDFFLKYGFLGPIVVFIYIMGIAFLGIDLRHPVVLSFFVLFFTSNLVDDFLLRFDGIVFSGFWFAIFGSYWLQLKTKTDTESLID
jgi:hypothetical protein